LCPDGRPPFPEKDPIEPGGEWIGSVDLENALMRHPAVREAAVIVFVAQIPRTSVGKFQKSRLREMFAGFRHEQAAAGNSD